MTKKVLTLMVVAVFMLTAFAACKGGSGGGGDYPTLNKALTKAIEIAKANKDNPEEGKKKIRELMSSLDKEAVTAESEKLGKAMEAKMEKLKEEMKGKQGMEAFGEAMKKMMEIIADELPAMKEMMELQMQDPKAAAILNEMNNVVNLNQMMR